MLKIKDEVIDINIIDRNNKNHKIKFPLLEENKLKEGDYFDEDGIHHIIKEEE